MKIGAEPKKVAFLGALLAVGGYFFYTNVIADSPAGPPETPKRGGAMTAQKNAINSVFNAEPAAAPKGTVVRAKSKASEEFHPSMSRKPEDAIDPMQIDPTIHFDLLVKVQAVTYEAGGRNPFQIGVPPPPPAPKVTVDTAKIKAAMNQAAQPTTPPPAAKPMTPVLNLPWKYYGYSSQRGTAKKKAFLLDGEDIMTASEGDVLKRKYRIVRIGVNSLVVEDTDNKQQQTLPLQEEAQA